MKQTSSPQSFAMITTTTTTTSKTRKLKKKLLLPPVVSFSAFFFFFVFWFVCCCIQNVAVAAAAAAVTAAANNNNHQRKTTNKKKKSDDLLKTKIANYKAGKAVIVTIHITHQAGTFLRQQADKNGIPYNQNISTIRGENRTEFLQQLLPTWVPPTTTDDDSDEVIPGEARGRFFKPSYAHDPTHPFLINYYNQHPYPNNEIYETKWDLFYDKNNISYFNWWESSGNTFRWSYHPWPDENNPFISHLDWESPHVIGVIIMRNPMDRLLACTPKCLLGKHTKIEDATPDDWWDFANDQGHIKRGNTDNFQLKSLTTPYYDISPHGVQSAKSLLERIDYIFDLDCLNPSLLKFSNDVGWTYIENLEEPPKKVKSYHVTARERINNDTLYEFLKEKNKLDIELYEWSKSKSFIVCNALDDVEKKGSYNHNNGDDDDDDDDGNNIDYEKYYYYTSYVLVFGIGFLCHYTYVHCCCIIKGGGKNYNNYLNNKSVTKGAAVVDSYDDDDDDDSNIELKPLKDEFNDEDDDSQ